MRKIFFITFALLVSSMMWAEVETYTFKSFTSSDKVKLSANNFNITLTKGTSNQPAFTSEQARIYPGGSLIISSANNITKVEYTYVINANKKGKVPTIDGVKGAKSAGTWTEETKTWTGSDTEVTFSISGEAGNVGFTSVTVTTDGAGGGGGGGSDTTKIEDVDGLEIDFYPSYSEVGAYDYTFLLYNSEDENYLPMIALDILTSKEKEYTGTYSVADETLTEYSYYVYGTGDDDYIEFTDGEVTITDNGEGNYTIKGWFTDGSEIYSVDVTLDGEYFNAEYPYEPEEKTTLNLTVTEGEIDETYLESYGVIDIYLTTAEGTVQLECYPNATTLEDGTYPIEAAEYDEDYSIQQTYCFFDAGYYYNSYGMALASYYQTEEEIYYLVGGTVKIETVAEGVKVTLAGTTYYGSTINAEYTIAPSALENVVASTKSEGKFVMNNRLLIHKNGVIYNAQGQIIERER